MNPSETIRNDFREAPFKLKFSRLSPKIKENLVNRMRGEGDGLTFRTSGIASSFVLISLAILWFGLLFYLSDDFLWSNFQLILFSLLSLAASFFLVFNIYKLFRWFTSESKFHLLITPVYIIAINFDDITVWNLEQLINIDSENLPNDRRYEFTKITLTLENGVQSFNLKGQENAEETVEQIGYLRKLFIEATAKNDVQYLNSSDDFYDPENPRLESLERPYLGFLPQLMHFFATVLLTVTVVFAAMSLNNYFDDKKSWTIAQTNNRASSYRNYLQSYPRGRWNIDASAKLQEFYQQAEKKYKDSLIKDFDPKAVEAVAEVIKYAAATQNYRVRVKFERKNEIPPDIIEKLKEENEVKRLISMDDTFSDENMSKREGELLRVLADAFRRAIPDDILEISNEGNDDSPVFLVKYSVNSDTVYYDLRQKNVPEGDRTYYPGIYLDWDFNISIPNQAQKYSFQLHSDPAETITYDSAVLDENKGIEDFYEVLNADKSNIYNAMATSAFEDFRHNLLLKIGIEPPPKKPSEVAIESVNLVSAKFALR